MIRPIGPRLLIRPVLPDVPDRLIQSLDDDPIVAGDVLARGAWRCDSCGVAQSFPIAIGARVALRPNAMHQEVTLDGETLWMVHIEDVIGEVEPLAHAG